MKMLRIICYLFVLLLSLPALTSCSTGAVGSTTTSAPRAAAGTITEYPLPTP